MASCYRDGSSPDSNTDAATETILMRAHRSILRLLTALALFTVAPQPATAAPPLLQQPVDILVVPGTNGREIVVASDADGEQLQFSKVSGPDFMSVITQPHLGTITQADMALTPALTDVGTYDAEVEVSDGGGGSAQGQFTIRTVIPTRPASGSIDFETPPFDGQRRTLDPYVDPATGIVFRSLESTTEVGLVKSTASSCIFGELEDQNLGTGSYRSNSIGLNPQGCKADFRTPLSPPCTVSVEFQTGAGAGIRLRLFDENGVVVGSATATAGPALTPCFSFQVPPAITRLTATSQAPVAYAIMDQPQPTYVLAFDNFEYSSPPPPVTATLNLDPDVINLASRARWVTAYIGLSVGSPANIDVTTLRLAGSIAPDPKIATVGDLGDGGRELMVKFSREALDPFLSLGVNDLTITGSLMTGEHIEATDQIRVIDPAGSHLAASTNPNPLHGSGTLNFTTTRSGSARVALFDVRGSLVRVLMETPSFAAGPHAVPLDGLGQRGQTLPTGVYFYKILTAEGSSRGRIVLSR
jgi:hypothetical protein